jgi:hypothetical protein
LEEGNFFGNGIISVILLELNMPRKTKISLPTTLVILTITLVLALSLVCIIRKAFIYRSDFEPFYNETPMLNIFTVVTDPFDKGLLALQDTLKRHSPDYVDSLHVLKSDLPVGYNKGHGPKITMFYEALQKITDEKSLVLFVDGYDVLFGAPIQEIIAKYNVMVAATPSKPILFGAEIYAWPDAGVAPQYDIVHQGKDVGAYKYLNSGTIMGPVKDIIELIQPMISDVSPTTDDQRFYTQDYLNNPLTKIQLDHKCEVFQCLASDMKDDLHYDTAKSRYYNYKTNMYPCLFHGNGDAKDFLLNVMKRKLM